MKTLEEVTAWLDAEYPTRDWNQWCAKLVWNVVWFVSGVPEREMRSYDPATAARHASTIVSTDAAAAPPGAIQHWVMNPDGHVGVSLGDGLVLMTGDSEALAGGAMLGNNYGVTTVWAYNQAKGLKYAGWSHTYGSNPTIENQITPGDEDMAFTQEDRELLISIKRALYDINIQDFEKRPHGIGREILRLRDSQFKTTETSFGTPGGVLATLRQVTDKLGITKPDEPKA